MASGPRYSIRQRGTAAFPAGRAGAGALPHRGLPGTLGGRVAAQQRQQAAGTPAVGPLPAENIKCALDYVSNAIRDKLGQFLINTQLHTRRPSYVDPPLSGICFDRHVGTGTAASGDPPVVVAPGGAPTFVADFAVPDRYRGVIKYWGVDVAEGAVANANVRWRIVVNGKRVTPFSVNYGAVVAAITGEWAGVPFTLTNPNRDLCMHLKSGDQVQLQALNFDPAPVNVSARFGGWIYQPTIDEPGLTVRATMTDQH